MNKILGPLLIVVGMLLLEMIRLNFSLSVQAGSVKLQTRAEQWGLAGAALLGVVFALSMCPVTAAIFFLTLIPLAARHSSAVLVPLIFGVGTALPVLVFAVILAVSARKLGGAFQRLQQFEKWARRVTGVVFILAGLYYCLAYIYEIPWLQGSS
jgi:cytochrome c-type biogenesis protein